MLDTHVAWLANQGMNYLATGQSPPRLGNDHPNIVPYQVFPTQDGHIVLEAEPGVRMSFAAIMAEAGVTSVKEEAASAGNKLIELGCASYTHAAAFVEVRVDEDLGVVRVTRLINAVAAGRILNPKYVVRTQAFFDRYGSRALVLARFVPIVRTFVTLVAGVGRMDFRRFIGYTAIGGVLWACGVTILGYFLGNVEVIKNNIDAVLVLIVLVSLIPMGVELLLHRRRIARGVDEVVSPDAPARTTTD